MAVSRIYAKLLLLVVLHLILACEYEEFGRDHTMCSFPTTTCPITRSGFSESEKDAITRAHNEMRQKVANGEQRGQPRASNMKEMGWSDELAKIAQTWADQCVVGHDSNRRTKLFGYVGQNVYTFWTTSSSSRLNVRDAVQAWYDEVVNPGFDSRNIDPFKFFYPAGHYTQLVWAETKAVGCGFVLFKKNSMYTHHIVCNYGPGGNMVGGAMYKVGIPCSRCKTGCSERYRGLCSGTGSKAFNEFDSTTENVDAHNIQSDSHSQHPGRKGDFKFPVDLIDPEYVVRQFVDTIFRGEETPRATRTKRPTRDVNYDYNNRNSDSFWQKAYDLFFGSCDGERSSQY